MKVSQVYAIMNTITGELLGDTAVVNEDLSNIVEIGKTFQNSVGLDNYVKKLNDVIGKMIFVDRIYKGRVPSVLMDGWEFGSILEKVTSDLPDATENEAWELENGASYDPNIFYQPSISVSLWNNRITFEIPVSITNKQVKSSFNSATQMNAFMTMIYTAIENSMTVKLDALIMRTINNFIGMSIDNAFSSTDYTGAGDTRAVNLLSRYNTAFGTSLTAAKAITTPEFIRFASEQILTTIDRMKTMSTLFNIGGKARFTPEDMMHIVMLSEFKHSSDVYLQSGVYHNELTSLPDAELVPYWQGSGTNYDFASTSAINIKTSENAVVSLTGVLCVIFDRDSLGVANVDRRVTSDYNAKAEFTNEWHKYDAGYFNDPNENFVVFYVA